MNGFLNINKPSGCTSHDVVAKIRRWLGVQKVGHTGTLDPAATGVLPICIGKATKVAQLLLETDKQYRVVMRLGEATDTEDATGTILERRPAASLTHEQIQKTVEKFQGPLWQVAPMYSAVKVGGEPLYKAARQGRQVQRPSRQVIIHQITLLGIEGRDGNDIIDVTFEVNCSKGTYIRTLCASIGEELGVGGHLSRLERRRSGPFHIDAALSLEEVQRRAADGSIGEKLISIEEVLSGYPGLHVSPEAENRVLHGSSVEVREVTCFPKEFKTGETILVYNKAGSPIALATALIGRDETACVSGKTHVVKVNRVLA